MGLFKLLPNEIIEMIVSYLTLRSWIRFSLTSRKLHQLYAIDLKCLLDKYANPRVGITPIDLSTRHIKLALVKASQIGEIGLVETVLAWDRLWFTSTRRDHHTICEAARNGQIEVLKLLLQDERFHPSDAVGSAADRGHLEAVKILLGDKRAIRPGHLDQALWNAVRRGHTEVVRALLDDERVNVSDVEVLRKAITKDRIEIIELLIRHPRFDWSNPDVDFRYLTRKIPKSLLNTE